MLRTGAAWPAIHQGIETMTATHLLLPRLDRLLTALPTQPIWSALGRADRLSDVSDTAVQAGFDVVPIDFGHAAVARLGEADDAGLYVWMRADPCWLQPDMSSLRMMAWGDMQLTLRDAEDLSAVVRPLFGDAGFEFYIEHPERWYLKLPIGSEPVRMTHPRDVLGDDVERHLPQGSSGQRWRRLLNEVQMSLHQHPVNRRREAAGLPPANSLWFWGGGRLPNRVRSAGLRYFTDDILLRGLARQAKLSCAPVQQRLDEIGELRASVVDLRAVAPETLNRDWLAPALHRLRSSAVEALRVQFSGGEQFLLRRAHRWRFWRGPLTAATASGARGIQR
jgi:hypothetical protein